MPKSTAMCNAVLGLYYNATAIANIADNGNGTYTVAFKSVDGTVTRIIGTATDAGDRSGTTLDGA